MLSNVDEHEVVLQQTGWCRRCWRLHMIAHSLEDTLVCGGNNTSRA